MFVFIDESGDPGIGGAVGQSRFFCMAMVIFERETDLWECDRRIDALRRELGLDVDFEFHFRENSKSIRNAFLRAISGLRFRFDSFSIDKNEMAMVPKLHGKEFFYRSALGGIFGNAKPFLQDAIVVMDKIGSDKFHGALAKSIRQINVASGIRHVKKIRYERSSHCNPLQVADYLAGVVNRSVQGKHDTHTYSRLISGKEIKPLENLEK